MDNNSPVERECDNPVCTKTFCATGDGATPYICDPKEGGKYFCSVSCQHVYAARPTNIRLHLEQAFREVGMPNPDISAALFVTNFSPTVREMESDNPNRREFEIKSAPAASLISCVIGGDESYQRHVGPDGIVHTPMRINDFALVISRSHPDALMREIRNVRLVLQVPLGDGVIISATKIPDQSRGGIATYKVESRLISTGKAASRPTIVTTVQEDL